MKILNIMTGIFILTLLVGFSFGDLTKSAAGSGEGSGGNLTADIDSFLKNSKTADKLMKNTIDELFKLVATKEELTEQNKKLKAANSISDPKERNAAVNKVHEEKEAMIKNKTANDESIKQIKKLEGKRAKAFSGALYNFALVILKDKDLIKNGKDIIKNGSRDISSLAGSASKFNELKESVSSISDQVDSLSDLQTSLTKLAEANNIKPELPESSASKPQKVKI